MSFDLTEITRGVLFIRTLIDLHVKYICHVIVAAHHGQIFKIRNTNRDRFE